jgi:uncharacterized protein
VEIKFTWDSNKNASNVVKHGIDFETAVEVFFDPKVAVVFSRREGGEDRYKALGRVKLRNGRMITVVVFALPSEFETRIISARCATRAERKLYG